MPGAAVIQHQQTAPVGVIANIRGSAFAGDHTKASAKARDLSRATARVSDKTKTSAKTSDKG